jgi:hypothetical protein
MPVLQRFIQPAVGISIKSRWKAVIPALDRGVLCEAALQGRRFLPKFRDPMAMGRCPGRGGYARNPFAGSPPMNEPDDGPGKERDDEPGVRGEAAML